MTGGSVVDKCRINNPRLPRSLTRLRSAQPIRDHRGRAFVFPRPRKGQTWPIRDSAQLRKDGKESRSPTRHPTEAQGPHQDGQGNGGRKGGNEPHGKPRRWVEQPVCQPVGRKVSNTWRLPGGRGVAPVTWARVRAPTPQHPRWSLGQRSHAGSHGTENRGGSRLGAEDEGPQTYQSKAGQLGQTQLGLG